MGNFCTQCGRPLQEGEVCNCTAQAAPNPAPAAPTPTPVAPNPVTPPQAGPKPAYCGTGCTNTGSGSYTGTYTGTGCTKSEFT